MGGGFRSNPLNRIDNKLASHILISTIKITFNYMRPYKIFNKQTYFNTLDNFLKAP